MSPNIRPSYEIAKKFIEDYHKSISLDFEKMKKQLSAISKSNYIFNKCNRKSSVSFVESDSLTRKSFTDNDNIYINKSRLTTIHRLNLDYNNNFYDNWLWGFYNSVKDHIPKREEEKLLFEFIKDKLPKNAEEHFPRIGTPKTTPYELLDIVFRENRKVYQKDYTDRLFNGQESPPNDLETKMLLFAVIYNFILNSIKLNKIHSPVKEEIYLQPAEFDLFYNSMFELNNIRKEYFMHDNMFALHIVNSNILPDEFDCTDTAKTIFSNYEEIYNLYSTSPFANSELCHLHNFIIANKELIICELESRFNQLIQLVEICKERLYALNDPYFIF